LDPQAALERFDPSDVPMADAQSFERNSKEMRDFLEVSGHGIEFFRSPLGYTSAQVEDLVGFLQTLTDPCVLDRDCLDPWVADPNTDDVDGQLIVAVDAQGNPL
jgi:cytochrome c peroxidase